MVAIAAAIDNAVQEATGSRIQDLHQQPAATLIVFPPQRPPPVVSSSGNR